MTVGSECVCYDELKLFFQQELQRQIKSSAMTDLRKRREGEEKTPDSAESDHVSFEINDYL